MDHYILAIETAGSPGSIALLNNEELVEQIFINKQQDTSSLISAEIQELIERNLESADQLSQVAVGIGPGSYTGLRVSMSTAKGLAFALDIPLIPVCSLKAIAHGFVKNNAKSHANITVLLNARNEYVFFAQFNAELDQLIEPKRRNIHEVLTQEAKNSTIISPHSSILTEISQTAIFQADQEAYFVGHASSFSNQEYNLQTIAYLEPNYIINNYIKKV